VGISKKPLHLSSTIAVLFTPEADPYQKLCQNNNDDNRFVSLRQMSAGQAVVVTDYFVSPLRVCVLTGRLLTTEPASIHHVEELQQPY
jgi:hypothetical protein